VSSKPSVVELYLVERAKKLEREVERLEAILVTYRPKETPMADAVRERLAAEVCKDSALLRDPSVQWVETR
jgi:hypothetical protein